VIFHVLTIFPEFFQSPFAYGVVKRAEDAGLLEIRIHNLRDWTFDRHKTVDDRPFGGGEGMVLKPDPVFRAVESIWGSAHASETDSSAAGLAGGVLDTPADLRAGNGAPGADCRPDDSKPAAGKTGGATAPTRRAVLLSAQGRLFDQPMANRFAGCSEILLICGRYEGVDERVAEHLADEEVSIGNYVLSGGELAAAIVIDATARLLPGVLGMRWAYSSTSSPLRSRLAYSRCAPTYPRTTCSTANSFLPMRRFRSSCLPASVSKNQWPSFFTMGIGKGQELVPTSSTQLVSDSWTNRLLALSAAVKALNSFVACTRSGFWKSAAAGPKMARKALPLFALVACTRAETASSGVAKVWAVSAALAAMGPLRANARNRALKLETRLVVFISVIEKGSRCRVNFIAVLRHRHHDCRRRRRGCHRCNLHCCGWNSPGCCSSSRWSRCCPRR